VKINPPRLAIWLLSIRLRDEWREFVVGDLEEEFETRSGPRYAQHADRTIQLFDGRVVEERATGGGAA